MGEPGNRETVYVETHEAADHLNSLTYGNCAGPPDVGDPDDLDGDYGGANYYSSDEDEEHTRLTYSEVSHEASAIVSYAQNDQIELRKLLA